MDLNAGSMRLTFSEPTDTAGFNPNGITISSTDQGTSVMLSDAFIASITTLNTVLTLTLGSMSLNNVKVVYLSGGLQLTLVSTTITDTAGNPILAIPIETPLLPQIVLNDLMPPTLRAFAPNPPSERRFTFFFDEYVSASSWNGDSLFITFSSAQGINEYTGFTTARGTVTPLYSDTINYTYSSSAFVPPLSTDYTNAVTAGSFSLRSTLGWVQDLGRNSLPAITTPIRFTNDTNRPTLESYSLDLNAGTLALVFSEPVSINTIVNQIRIQNTASSPTRVYSLTSNGTLSVPPGAAATTVTITLGSNDINSIKFDQSLATTFSNTFLVVLEDLGTDISGNPLVGLQSGLQATNLISDRQGPVVTSTAVDLNSGMVSVRFNEPVSQTVDLSQIYVTGTARTSPGGYNLTGSAVLPPAELATLLTIVLSQNVLNMIKVDSQVCSGSSNCYLYYTSASFSDVTGNRAVASSPAVSVSNYTEDATRPVLSSYTVDLNQGQLVLTFSEATNGMVNPGITLFGTASGSGSIALDFSVNSTFRMSNTILTFTLDLAHLNQLKIITNMSQLALAMQTTAIYDTSNIPVVPISMTSPLPPAAVIRDTTPPTLLMFTPGYPTERRITLVFDEFVNPATWNGNQFTLTLTTVQGSNNYNGFTQGSLTTMLSDRIVYSFSAGEYVPPFSDQYSLAYYEGMVAFAARTGLISDIAGNPVAATTMPFVFQNTTMTASDTPSLTDFDIDMNSGVLLLTFSEDIIVSSVSGQVRLQNAAANPTQSYTLARNGTISNTALSTVLSLTMDRFDLNNIKLLTFLATSAADSFLLIMNGFGRDTMNNAFNSTMNGPVQANAYTRDTTPPRVESFNLYNDDNGSMVLSFDEPVNFGSVTVTLITLIGGPNSPLTYSLTDGQYIDLTGSRLSLLFILAQSDVAAIRQMDGLAESTSTTYVVVGANMCRDLAGNSMQQIPISSPIQVESYIADTGAASLQSFNLDLNFGSLSLTFNDIIDVTTINVANLTIQNSSTSAANSYTLTGSRRISPTSSRIIMIDFSFTDWNALRSNLNLATGQANTFISFPATFANTVGGAPLQAVPETGAQRVSLLTPDGTPLQLSLFSIDFNNGLMHFEFLKPVLVSSAEPTAIQLQNARVNPSALYTLTGGEITTSSIVSRSLDVQMSLDDIIALDRISNLATSTSDTYINFVGNFVTDTSGNALLRIVNQVSSFIADIGPPQLLYFDVNVTESMATLILSFSEGVQFLAGSQGSFTLQSSQNNSQPALTFNNLETITQPAREVLVITLRNDYFNLFRSSNGIGSSANQLYITYSAGGVSDYYGNQAVTIPQTNALRVRYIYRACGSNSYNNLQNGTCDLCASVCIGGCSGNLTTAGVGGCNMCTTTLLDSTGMQDTCTSNTCPQGYYVSTAAYPTLAQLSNVVCSPCHNECSICNGPTTSDCQACKNAFQTRVSGGIDIGQCLTSCPDSTGSSSPQCFTCHPQCNGCQGMTNRDCISCLGPNVTVSGQTVCVPQCSMGQYLNMSTYACQPCNDQCLSCSGPANTQCQQCKGAMISAAGGTMTCLASCPIGMYQSSNGLCKDCHELCSGDGCSGPTESDCNSCVGNSVSSANTTKCVADCPFAHDFDDNTGTCALSSGAMTAIIVCAVLGGVILFLLVVVLPVCCCVWFRTRKGKLAIRSEAPLISRQKDDAYTYGEDHTVSFTSASSPL